MTCCCCPPPPPTHLSPPPISTPRSGFWHSLSRMKMVLVGGYECWKDSMGFDRISPFESSSCSGEWWREGAQRGQLKLSLSGEEVGSVCTDLWVLLGLWRCARVPKINSAPQILSWKANSRSRNRFWSNCPPRTISMLLGLK